jgi:curved DNA-binding protein CbpA
MSKIEIEFNNMKYNLYDILNVPRDSDEVKIKKSFMKLIKNFHPDKNSELEEEIYYHLILSNQVLLNKDSRKKYDDFLAGCADTFIDLKDNFNKNLKENKQHLSDKDISHVQFTNKLEELNKKHGYSTEGETMSVIERFEKARQKRTNDEIKIEKEDIKDEKDFNLKFNFNKTDGKFKDQIVEYHGSPSELSIYIAGEHYTNLSDMDKLYLEDSIQSSKYSSLDRAFSLHPITQNTDPEKCLIKRMDEYRSQTELYSNMNTTDFVNKKFDEW